MHESKALPQFDRIVVIYHQIPHCLQTHLGQTVVCTIHTHVHGPPLHRYGGISLGRAGDWTSSGRKNPKIAARGRAPKSDSGLSYGPIEANRGSHSGIGGGPQQQRTRAERAMLLVGGSNTGAASGGGGASFSLRGGVRESSRQKIGAAKNDDR